MPAGDIFTLVVKRWGTGEMAGRISSKCCPFGGNL
tara:strand:- start:2174 stop:2278 length:105 start_codon:yes stop_codon:yes gene_type:complete